jgi:hypothetical protein
MTVIEALPGVLVDLPCSLLRDDMYRYKYRRATQGSRAHYFHSFLFAPFFGGSYMYWGFFCYYFELSYITLLYTAYEGVK